MMTTIPDKRINAMRATPGAPVWQRKYYENTIRSESALPRIRQYIADHPARWPWAPENPAVRDIQDPYAVGATGRSPLHCGER